MINFNIMGIRSRQEHIDELVSKLNCKVFYDEGFGIWQNRVNCLTDHLNYEYGVTIQDDAILTEDFKEKIGKWIKKYPNKVITFYMGRRKAGDYMRRIDEAKSLDMDKIELGWLGWGVCLYVPKSLIPIILTEWKDNKNYLKYDDTRIGKTARKHSFKVIGSVPSLVNHKQIKSAVGNKEGSIGKREAYYFV
jgi:hypothetical protein